MNNDALTTKIDTLTEKVEKKIKGLVKAYPEMVIEALREEDKLVVDVGALNDFPMESVRAGGYAIQPKAYYAEPIDAWLSKHFGGSVLWKNGKWRLVMKEAEK